MYPRSSIGKVLAAAWLCLCVLLWVGFSHTASHDMPIAFFWLVTIAAAPVGFLAAIAWPYVFEAFGPASGSFAPYFVAWLVSVTLGYAQWFIATPIAWRALPTPRAKLRFLLMAVALVVTTTWGSNDLANERYLSFFARIFAGLGVTWLVLLWAAKEPKLQ